MPEDSLESRIEVLEKAFVELLFRLSDYPSDVFERDAITDFVIRMNALHSFPRLHPHDIHRIWNYGLAYRGIQQMRDEVSSVRESAQTISRDVHEYIIASTWMDGRIGQSNRRK
ncbi:MAG: hypothetical protein ACJ8C4_06245 [Gemmataceae bacterium]